MTGRTDYRGTGMKITSGRGWRSRIAGVGWWFVPWRYAGLTTSNSSLSKTQTNAAPMKSKPPTPAGTPCAPLPESLRALPQPGAQPRPKHRTEDHEDLIPKQHSTRAKLRTTIFLVTPASLRQILPDQAELLRYDFGVAARHFPMRQKQF